MSRIFFIAFQISPFFLLHPEDLIFQIVSVSGDKNAINLTINRGEKKKNRILSQEIQRRNEEMETRFNIAEEKRYYPIASDKRGHSNI